MTRKQRLLAKIAEYDDIASEYDKWEAAWKPLSKQPNCAPEQSGYARAMTYHYGASARLFRETATELREILN